ncbi:hypothetical protein CsatA_002386 [Cannabis sativa]
MEYYSVYSMLMRSNKRIYKESENSSSSSTSSVQRYNNNSSANHEKGSSNDDEAIDAIDAKAASYILGVQQRFKVERVMGAAN